ncbi:MAG: hypothetical protein DMD72_03345, partial [Gemmatimonadetes bacterium]
RQPSTEDAEPAERSRRGRRGGRGRDREGRGHRQPAVAHTQPEAEIPARHEAPREAAAPAGDEIGISGLRLRREEAFDLVRRAVGSNGGAPIRASLARATARELLGRDSESLSERNFIRILQDAHDADVVDLRRRGDDYE